MAFHGSLRRKIFFGYVGALVIVFAILLWAFQGLVSIGKSSSGIITENLASIRLAFRMIALVESQDNALLMTLLGHHDQGRKSFLENQILFLEALGRARNNVTVPGEKEVIEELDGCYHEYIEIKERVDRLVSQDREAGRELYLSEIKPASAKLKDKCEALQLLNERAIEMASRRAEDILNQSTWSMSLLGIAAILLGFVFSIAISSIIVKPLETISNAAQRIADGDYNVEVPVRAHDEIGILGREFNTMTRRLAAYQEMNVEQMLAEKTKWEAIIRNIDDGIIVIDAVCQIMEINTAALKALDMKNRSVKNLHFLQVVPSEKLLGFLKDTLEHGSPPEIESGRNVITITLDDQRRFHYLFSITPLRSKSGMVSGAVLLLKDVTKLKELDELKNEFVMIASHELRTPLTSIGMSIDLLLEKTMRKLDSNEITLLKAAQEDTLRLKALVNDLLDLSKIEAGKIELELEPVRIDSVFRKVFSILKPQTDERGIEFFSDPIETLPMIRADETKITWVLNNLVSNAMRYTSPGGFIRMSARVVGPYMHVSVEDNGSGIPLEYQSKIFDKFVKVKDDKHVSGSGLGLAICKEMVKAHGGTIWVDSAPGKGSTFTFTMPVVQ